MLPAVLGASMLAPSLAAIVLAQAQAQAPAPAPPALSLREAIERAAGANPDLLRERVAVEIASANLLAAQGQFDFVLTAGGTFAQRTTPPIGAGSELTTGFARTLTLDGGLGRALETGGRVAIGAQEIATTTNSRIQCGVLTGNVECGFHASAFTLTFTHPLLRGFGREVATANVRRQHILRDIALLNRQARAAVVVRDVVSAYWALAYAADDLAIRRAAVTLAAEQRKATLALVEVGRVGALELAAVERAIADREQDVALAEQALLGRGLDLDRLLAREVSPHFRPYGATDRPAAGDAAVDTAAETARALASSPQLRALRAGVALSELDARTAQALTRPVLDFTGTIGAAGRKPDLADAWAQSSSLDILNWSAGLTFQMPIQNRAARGVSDAARATADRARIDAADLELGIRDGVVRLAAAVRTAARRHQLAGDAVRYAGKNLEAEKARFEVGRSTNNDVLLRQQELKTAEVQVVRAAADQAIAEAALAALTGDILERYGLVLR
jgi:outer membrane protein TolC